MLKHMILYRSAQRTTCRQPLGERLLDIVMKAHRLLDRGQPTPECRRILDPDRAFVDRPDDQMCDDVRDIVGILPVVAVQQVRIIDYEIEHAHKMARINHVEQSIIVARSVDAPPLFTWQRAADRAHLGKERRDQQRVGYVGIDLLDQLTSQPRRIFTAFFDEPCDHLLPPDSIAVR